MGKSKNVVEKVAAIAQKAKARKGKTTVIRGNIPIRLNVLKCYDISAKDGRVLMDVAVFRLSKKDKRLGDVLRYEMSDGFVEVSSGPNGMASVWDYDIVLMAISHLTEAMNHYRKHGGEKPGRVFTPHVSEILKFCRRTEGGRQRDEVVGALQRLNTTHLRMQRVKQMADGEAVVISEGESLINRYRVISREKSGKVAKIEIQIPEWIYTEVTKFTDPEVLTVHPDFFLIEAGMGKFLYRLARKAAGNGSAKWAFKTLYERSGSKGEFKEFCRLLRALIEVNDLPEYRLSEKEGKTGPMLVMTHRK